MRNQIMALTMNSARMSAGRRVGKLVQGVVAGCLLVSGMAWGKTIREQVEYQVGDTQMRGVLIYDETISALRPGLVLVPNWMGINAANLAQAETIAGSRYVVFVADMYGVEVRPSDAKAAGAASGAVKSDRALMRKRVNAALDQLKQTKLVLDPSRLGAIGFCFGGTAVLELARSGSALQGVVSFHGGLDSPKAEDAKQIKAKVLVLHGADDPYVPEAQVNAFEQEMRAAKTIDWQLVSYGGAVHSFTDPDANSPGQAQFNPVVSKRAFAAMEVFFNEAFAGVKP